MKGKKTKSAREQLRELVGDLHGINRRRKGDSIPVKQLANLVDTVLRGPAPELRARLDGLWEYARSNESPISAAYAPRRNSSMLLLRDFWWLQALIIVAQGFSSRVRWIVPKDLDASVLRAAEAR